MKTWSLLALALALLASSACGNNHLTSDQKAQLSDTMSSAGRATSTAQQQQKPAASISGLTSVMTSAPNVDPMSARLQDAFDKKQCSVNTLDHQHSGASSTSGASTSSMGQVNVQVTGDKCPVVMDFEFGASGDASSGNINIALKLKYQVQQDPDYQAMNDVDGMAISGSISGSQAGMDINISGKIHSQKYGNVPISLTGHLTPSGSGPSGTLEATFQFPSFTADLKMESKDSETKYRINDEEVSKDEFFGYFSKAGINGSTVSSPNMGGNPGPKS